MNTLGKNATNQNNYDRKNQDFDHAGRRLLKTSERRFRNFKESHNLTSEKFFEKRKLKGVAET